MTQLRRVLREGKGRKYVYFRNQCALSSAHQLSIKWSVPLSNVWRRVYHVGNFLSSYQFCIIKGKLIVLIFSVMTCTDMIDMNQPSCCIRENNGTLQPMESVRHRWLLSLCTDWETLVFLFLLKPRKKIKKMKSHFHKIGCRIGTMLGSTFCYIVVKG